MKHGKLIIKAYFEIWSCVIEFCQSQWLELPEERSSSSTPVRGYKDLLPQVVIRKVYMVKKY